MNGGLEICLDEVEEGLQVGVTAVLGLLLPTFGDFVQKGENFLGRDGSKVVLFAKVLTELGESGAVGLNRIFFQNSSCGTPCRLGLHGRVS